MSSSTPTTPRNARNPVEVKNFVKDMLDDMENEFNLAGNTILGRMDKVGKRMDDLERSITDLMTDAGLEAPESPSSPTRPSLASHLSPQSSKGGSTVL